MPGTASSKLQSRAHAKARPSANARAASLVANTPVLFRLPLIPNVPSQELSATYSESAAGLPTAQLSAVATASSASLAVGSSSGGAAGAAATNSQTEARANSAPARTWWEHWSSGIVLIVLLIALATASIWAWQGGSNPSEKLIADTDKSSDPLSDLSTIEVPKIDVPTLELPTLTSKPAASTQAASEQGNTTDETSEDSSSLIPSGPMGLSFEAPGDKTNSTTNTEVSLKPEMHATASLQSPEVKPQEPLFKDEPSAGRSTISAQPASSPSSFNSSTSGASPALWDSSTNTTSDKSAESGAGLTLELTSSAAGSPTNSLGAASQPSYGNNTNTASGTPTQLISQPMTSSNATSNSSAGTAVPTNLQFAGKTTTPEFDHAALIATYRQYSGTDMSAPPTDSTANRYKATAPTTSTFGPQSSAGVPTSMVGFTQPPVQQQPAPQTNYTLGSSSSLIPQGTTATQTQQQFQQPSQQPQIQNQYPNSQLQNTQVQSTPYQNTQYQNNQYSQPQYPVPPNSSQYQASQYQAPQYQAPLNPQNSIGTQVPTSQAYSGSNSVPSYPAPNYSAPNTGTSLNTGNGYYIPPTTPTNTQSNVQTAMPANPITYPSLK